MAIVDIRKCIIEADLVDCIAGRVAGAERSETVVSHTMPRFEDPCGCAPKAWLDRSFLGYIIWYISFLRGRIMHTAKVFQNGRSQAIRLPKEFRVANDEVYLKKTSEGFLVIARDPWEIFFEGVAELSDDFMAGGRRQPQPQKRKWKA
jgi:antitoxin VapB